MGALKNYNTMTIINMTPHRIDLCHDGEWITSFEPSGKVVRLDTWELPSKLGDGFFVARRIPHEGGVDWLPVKPRQFYIVSTMVREAFPSRLDFISPAQVVRDEHGRPKGCNGFHANY